MGEVPTVTRYYNDLADHDRSFARDQLEWAAWEAAQDVDDDVDDDSDEDDDEYSSGCPICERARCSGYCETGY